jgi:magnesium-transporting ATPase (P-type)
VANDVSEVHITIHKWAKGDEGASENSFVVFMCGQLEIVLSHCATFLLDGNIEKLDKSKRKDIHNHYDTLSSYGENVVALAYLPLPLDKYPDNYQFDFYPPNFPVVCCSFRHALCSICLYQKELCFVGLLGTAVRHYSEAVVAIKKCKDLDVRLIILSEASPLAVARIANKVGLFALNTIDENSKKVMRTSIE